ncbi:MAG: hypothetical protein JW955_21525 [Sedimentisphaerales bacterium]|nr:hypothetical protein [Sedimentisphaerales bacterium]
MVRVRENTQKHLTRHTVATLLVRAALPATTIKDVMIMVVGQRKEAAP